LCRADPQDRFHTAKNPSRPQRQLEAENAALRQQLTILQRKQRGRVQLTNNGRLFFILYRWFPSVLRVMTMIQPETLLRWHREGFRRCWRWKSGNRGGRPPISVELRALIRRISIDNRLWECRTSMASCSSSASKYMVKPDDCPQFNF
jgi:hypothetical protein